MSTASTEYDWSELETAAEPRDTNVLPRTGTARTAAGSRRGRARGTRRLETLQKSLSGQMFQAGAVLGLGMPVTGYYICQESDSFTKAVLALATRKTEWMDALEKIADIAPGISAGRTLLGIAAAMGADRYHRTGGQAGFSPEKRALQFLGVTSAYYAVHGEEGREVSYTEPPHGAFIPVS